MTFINRAATTVPAVLADIDDIHTTVGFWQPQPDFRIVEKLDASRPRSWLSPTRARGDLRGPRVNWTKYQTNVVLRALAREPNAEPRYVLLRAAGRLRAPVPAHRSAQATDPTNPATIGAGQDQAKVARYHKYLRTAYRAANEAVQRVIEAVGTDRHGVPHSNVIVVSDHGFRAVPHRGQHGGPSSLPRVSTPPRCVPSLPAPRRTSTSACRDAKPNGTVTADEYVSLQQQLVKALRELSDANPNYHGRSTPVFDQVFARPTR